MEQKNEKWWNDCLHTYTWTHMLTQTEDDCLSPLTILSSLQFQLVNIKKYTLKNYLVLPFCLSQVDNTIMRRMQFSLYLDRDGINRSVTAAESKNTPYHIETDSEMFSLPWMLQAHIKDPVVTFWFVVVLGITYAQWRHLHTMNSPRLDSDGWKLRNKVLYI